MAIQYVSVASKTRLHFLLLSGSRWTLRQQAICGRAAGGFDSSKARDLTREQILLEYGDPSRGGVCRSCIRLLSDTRRFGRRPFRSPTLR